jgi:hypothetical protein
VVVLTRPVAGCGRPTEPNNGGILVSTTRLNLEVLEDRTAPTNYATNATIVSAGPAYYNQTLQTETVTAQATYVNGSLQVPVPLGTTINITDGGKTHSVVAGLNGQATTTFYFPLFQGQEIPGAHTVSTQVPLQNILGTTDVLLQSTNSNNTAQAPDTTSSYYVQLAYDALLVLSGEFYYL